MKLIASISAVIAAFALTVSADDAKGPMWGYKDDPNLVHTSQWGTNWPACAGDRQSPIDIDTTTRPGKGKRLPLHFSGQCHQYNLSEPQEPLEVDVVGGNCAVSVNNATYNLLQFHMHAASEHTLDGEQLDAEIHFVHSSSDGKALLVVGIFLEIGPKSDGWLGPLLDALEQVHSVKRSKALMVNLRSYSALVKKAMRSGGIYNYPGSLTTPGCDATVDWWVVQNPIKISSIDFGRLHQDLVEYDITDNGDNARPTQPLNGRVVTRYN